MDRHVGMLRAEALFINGERTAVKRLGLSQPVGGSEQLGQVVEVDRHVGMLRAEALFINGERTAVKRLGLSQPVGGSEQPGQAVEVSSPRWDDPGRSSFHQWRAHGGKAVRPQPAGWRRGAAQPGC